MVGFLPESIRKRLGKAEFTIADGIVKSELAKLTQPEIERLAAWLNPDIDAYALSSHFRADLSSIQALRALCMINVDAIVGLERKTGEIDDSQSANA